MMNGIKGNISSDANSLEGLLNEYFEQDEQIPLLLRLGEKIHEIHKDIICGIGENGTILYCNTHFRNKFSYEDTPIDNQSFFSFIYPNDIDNVRSFLSGELAEIIDADFFCRMIAHPGDIIGMRWRIWAHESMQKHTPLKFFLIGKNPSKDTSDNTFLNLLTAYFQKIERERDGKIRNIHNKLLDEIAKREVIEREIATLVTEMENEVVKLKEIINYTSQLVLVFDIMGNLQYINSQGAELFGSPVNTLIGKNISELPFQEQIIRIFHEYSNMTPDQGDHPLSGMVEITSPSPRIYFYSLMPLYDMSGIRESILMILGDVSDPKNPHTPPLSPLAEDPKAVIDRALHTFNNLFTILLGNLTLAQCCQDLESDTSHYLKNIEADIARAGNLLYRYSLLYSAEKISDSSSISPESEYGIETPQPEVLLRGTDNQYILFMDDESGILDIASKVLQNLGFRVETGRNGEAILKAYVNLRMDHQTVSCVILDLDVPGGMGAIETLPHLKFFNPSLPVILTTGHTKHPVLKNFKKYGFSGVITKPFYPRKLKEKIREILENEGN